MKVKFTLNRQQGGPVDLVATVDSATTAGDLASYLAQADPVSRQQVGDVGLTLAVASTGLSLDHEQLIADSGLKSGDTVSLVPASRNYVDGTGAAVAVLTIVEGQDAGREFQVPAGSSVIGRERGCDVRLSDELVSRRHARLNVTDGIEIIDLGSANGIEVDDVAVSRSVLREGDVVTVGDTKFTVRRLRPVAAESGGSSSHIRSPRLDPVFEGQKFEAPELPERPRRQRLPIIALIVPILMGGVLFLIYDNVASIVFVALSPLMLIGSAIEQRRSAKADYREAVKEFRADVELLVTDVREAGAQEILARAGEHPSGPDSLAAAREGSALLWTRRPDGRAFGEVRLGLGRDLSRHTIELPRVSKASRELFKELVEATAPLAYVEPVPVVAAFGETAVGVAGPRSLALPAARSLVAQLVALHSPAELTVTAVVSNATASDWDWLKWLPHSSSLTSPVAARHLVSSSSATSALVSELEELVEGRESSQDEARVPAVLVLVEDDAPSDHSRLVHLAERGPEVGVYVLWVAPALTRIPAACKTYLDVERTGETGTVGYVHAGTAITPVLIDGLSLPDVQEMARALSPVVDVGARGADASDLPRSVSLAAIAGVELLSDEEAVIQRWMQNRSILTGPFAPAKPVKYAGNLRAVIGEGVGLKMTLDLRADGPHALVGGTTGSGKSELLQAWILGMAAAHSPQRLNFLLIDYKGGSAFRDCADLPHTVGQVSDLTPHMVDRVLVSLKAELTWREHVLARHGAKDLVTLERQGVVDAPPSLVIVVDEFAALITEVPDAADEVVNIAQRGRSLGLHLILATQRPAGVIKDNLRANTNLRVALRMADETDSSDVLGSPDAAFFPLDIPGRAVAKTGPGRLIPFQAAYTGGWTTDEPPPPDLEVEELTLGVPSEWDIPEDTEAAPVDLGPTDARRLVDAIVRASEAAQLPAPRIPWQPELRSAYDLGDRSMVPNQRKDSELVFGILDDPASQTQPTACFYPDRDGNLAVYGTGGSGKSTLLRTLAISAGFTFHGGPCHVYGIDFGARGLAMLEDLPHVGSIILGTDHERITRLLTWLRQLIDERAQRYNTAGVNASSIGDYREKAKRPEEPRILLVVDGIAAFRSAYETSDRLRWLEMFTSIALDGRPVGVHVVLSSEQRTGLTTAMASAVQSRVVLRQASADDYGVLGVPEAVLAPDSPPGRGLIGSFEVQVATLGGTSDVGAQAASIKRFGEAMLRSGASPAEPIGRLSDEVVLDDLPVGPAAEPVIGLASASLGPVSIEPRGSFLITGPPSSGRTTALITLAAALRRSDPGMSLHYFGRSRSEVASLDVWNGLGLDQKAADVATALTAQIEDDRGSRRYAVFLEAVAEFDTAASDALAELGRVILAEGHFLVGEGELTTVTSSFGVLGHVKSSRTGLALQPDANDGPTFRSTFPRLDRNDFPPGRGLLVKLGKFEIVQVATTAPSGGG